MAKNKGPLATGAQSGPSVILWNVKTGKEDERLRGHSAPVSALAFSPDGKFLLTGAGDHFDAMGKGEVKRWELATGKGRSW